MNRITRIILIVLTISLLYGIILYFIIKDGDKCDQHVVLTDGTEMDCTDISSRDNGITYIRLCDKSKIEVPTQRIKVITELNVRD